MCGYAPIEPPHIERVASILSLLVLFPISFAYAKKAGFQLRLAPNSIAGVLMLVAIAVAQTLPTSQAVVIQAATSAREHSTGYGATSSYDPSDDWPTYHRDIHCNARFDSPTPTGVDVESIQVI